MTTPPHHEPEMELFRSTAPRPITSPEEAPAAGMVPDHVRALAWFLDDAIPFFGNRRIGADGFLSLIPGVGDAAGFGLSGVVILSAVRAGASWVTVARMTVHALLESIVGLIPFLGPVFAFFWKANNRNLRIIEKDLANREATRRESWKVLIAMAVILVLSVGLVLLGIGVFVWFVLDRMFGG